MTRHKIVDEARRRREVCRWERIDFDEEGSWFLLTDPSLIPEARLEQQEIRQAIHEAIARLPKRYQRVVTLRYVTQLPFSQIARLIGIPEATAKTHFQRARFLLRASLVLPCEHALAHLPLEMS